MIGRELLATQSSSDYLGISIVNLRLSAVAFSSFVAASSTVAMAQADSHSTVTVQPQVKVTACQWSFDNPSSRDYDITIGASFMILSEKTAVAVKFSFTSFDDFGKRLSSRIKTVYGQFSPNAVIEPRRRIGDHTIFTDATTAAIDFSNSYGTEVTKMLCRVEAVKYADGTIWTNTTTIPNDSP